MHLKFTLTKIVFHQKNNVENSITSVLTVLLIINCPKFSVLVAVKC